MFATPRAKGSTPRGFLPDFCAIPLVLGVLLTAELLAIVLMLASIGPGPGFWGPLGLLSLYVQIIALTGATLLCLLRPLLARLDSRLTALICWVVLLVVTAGVNWGTYLSMPENGAGLLPAEGLPGLMDRSLGICAIVVALLLHYLYLHHLWRQQVEAEANARFQELQARIRPHFLFNSINTIANLTHKDPQLAEVLLQDLADLFRAAMGNQREATLSDELELVRHYLRIEGQRLGERLHVEWDLEELPGDAALPQLTLQPLVENAVYHGIQPAREPGLIRITGRYRRGRVNLSVRNSLPAQTDRPPPTQGNRMALDNVRQRLTAMYPEVGRVIEARVEGDFQVRLVIPYPRRER